jgi:hypothetical protein
MRQNSGGGAAMTIIEILDGLAELGRLRLEREARERAEAAEQAQPDKGKTEPAQAKTKARQVARNGK